MHDTFYAIHKLSKTKQLELFLDAKSKCDTWRVDKKDDTYTRREMIYMSFDDIVKIFNTTYTNKHHVVFIHRLHIDVTLEIGFCTMGLDNDYFLFINVKPKHLQYFIDKYNLDLL